MIKKLFILLVTCPNNLRYSTSFRKLSTQIMQPIPNITRFDGLIRILGQNPGAMTLQGTNSYLIGNSQRRLLLDTTEPDKKDYVELLQNVLKDENDVVITDVVITHWHNDHIGALSDLRDKGIVDDNCKVWKFPRNDAHEDFDKLKINKLNDKHEFKVDEDTTLEVHYTPGHTTDHVILFNKKDKTLYSGDCILGEGTAVFEDLYDYMKSLDKILELKPEKIYPGHGNVITDAMEKIQYYIAHRQERERQIFEALVTNKAPLTAMGIVKIVYKETPENLWPAAAFNVHHHLTKLKKEGRLNNIEKDNEEYWEVAVGFNKL